MNTVFDQAVQAAIAAVKKERARFDWSADTDCSREAAQAAAKRVYIFAEEYDYDGAMEAAEDALLALA